MPALVVEDDRDSRELLCEILEQEGFQPMRAYNGREALSFLRSLKPCFLVLDLAMPEMSGWELLDKLHERQDLAGVPVIVVAGRPLSSAGLRRSDVTAYFQKPLDVDRFVQVIGILRRRREQAEATPGTPAPVQV